jgi:DNA-binding CsgD family transcriptional regulator
MLTPREVQVMDMLAEGKGTKEIRRALGCTESTLRVHVANVKRKAGVGGALHKLVVWYLVSRREYKQSA